MPAFTLTPMTRTTMSDSVIVTAYGSGGADRGIKILGDGKEWCGPQFLPVDGKCNFCIRVRDRLYTPVQKEQSCCMQEYRLDEKGRYALAGSYPTQYFYSYGAVYGNFLLLASFSDGVDAIYDMEQHREIDFCIHQRAGYEQSGRSHYIGITPDRRHAFAVDNGLQQIYLYDIVDGRFAVRGVREFCEENIRLMSYSPFSGCYYLNTEKTNRVYVLDYVEEQFHIRGITDLSCEEKSFSGGNAVSPDGQRLCISVRGDDHLHYFKIRQDGELELLDKIHCGKMPRDVIFEKDGLYVTCTNDNVIEKYRIKDSWLEKNGEISVCRPITFGL